MAVGSGIMPLDAFTAFTAVASMVVTVHIFAIIGVPVSTSQAIVGSIIGIGLIRGTQAIKITSHRQSRWIKILFTALRNIMTGWLLTPVIALILAAAGYAVFT